MPSAIRRRRFIRWKSTVLAVLGSAFCTAAAHAASTTTYTYDALGRLVQASTTGTINNGAQMTTTYDELTKDIPKEFGLFLKYSRNLEFEDQPRYNYLRDLMREIAIREDIIIDNQFDWL